MNTAVQWPLILTELEESAASQDSPAVFFQQLLQVLSRAMEARAGACWMRNQNQYIGLLSEHRFLSLGLQDDLQATRLNQRILTDALASPGSKIVPFQLRNDAGIHFTLLLPILHKGDCVGVLQFLAEGEPWQLDSEDHRNFDSVVRLIDQYLQRHDEMSRETDPSAFMDSFRRFSAELHSSLNPSAIGVTAVNDAVSILRCDRATLLLRRASRWDVVAVSGHAALNPRSNQIRLLQDLTEHVGDLRDVLLYSGNNDKIPPQVADSLAAYVADSGSQMLMLRPLFHPVPPNQRTAESVFPDHNEGRLLGAIVFEQFTVRLPSVMLQKHADPICDQISLAMANALAYRRIPLLPLFDFVGSKWELVRQRLTAKLFVLFCCVVTLITCLGQFPAEYKVEARGKLMPAVQRRVFADFDGEILAMLVQPGERVESGTPLITLRNDAFEDELRLLRSQRDERRKSLLGMNSELHSASKTGDRGHLLRLQGEIEQCRIDISSLQSQIGQVEQKIDRLTLRAPITGTVVTFVDQQQLIGRPVFRGETLLEIMDEHGLWRLELEIPEDRLHHLRHGISVYGEKVPATFQLSADAGNEFTGWLSHTSERSTDDAEDGAVVRLYVSLTDDADCPKRIGADVRTNLHCGEYSLFYVMFGDAVEFAQRNFWF